MRRFWFVMSISLAFLLSGPDIAMAYEKEVKSLSSTLVESIAKEGKKTVAVVDFTDLQGNVTELGRFIAEEFSVALAGSGKGFEVIDRMHLKVILKEHKLAVTDIIDPTTARKLGQIAGVDALITGTITPFGDTVRIAVKVLDTATARVVGASSGNIAKTKAIEELLTRGIGESGQTARGSSTVPSAPAGIGKVVKTEDFIFKPLKCKRGGSKTTCIISFQNNGNEDRQLRVNGAGSPSSYLYDNLGNQYPVFVQIGRKTHSHSLIEKFIPQLPINVQFIAEDVVPEATHMTVAIGIYKFKRLVAVRNVPITK